MKLNRIIVCIMICVMMVTLIGCVDKISETPVDTEYVPDYDAMETVYEYQWDWYLSCVCEKHDKPNRKRDG